MSSIPGKILHAVQCRQKKKKELKQSKKPRVLEKKERKLKQTGNENKMFARSKTKVTETIPEDVKTHGSLHLLFKSRHT